MMDTDWQEAGYASEEEAAGDVADRINEGMFPQRSYDLAPGDVHDLADFFG